MKISGGFSLMKIEEKQDVVHTCFSFVKNKKDQSFKSLELGNVGLKFLTMLFTEWEVRT